MSARPARALRAALRRTPATAEFHMIPDTRELPNGLAENCPAGQHFPAGCYTVVSSRDIDQRQDRFDKVIVL